MAERNNAKCSICGKDYYMCLSCKDAISTNPWKVHTDTAEHYKIFQIIRGFSTGVYTKDEVRTKLKNVDLSDLETYKPNIKSIIKDVLKEESVVEGIKSTTIEEEVPVIQMTAASRRKKYKVEIE